MSQFSKNTTLFLIISVGFWASFNQPSSANDGVIEFEQPSAYRQKERSEESRKKEYLQLKKNSQKNPPLTDEQKLQLTELAKEPRFAELERHMLLFTALPTGNDFKKYRSQARLRNLLPDINGDYDFGRQRNFAFGNDYNYDIIQPNTGSTSPTGTYNNNQYSNRFDNSRSGYHNRGLSTGLDWSLKGLIYDNEVTDIISEQRRIAGIRHDLVSQLHEVYYSRKKRQVEFILHPAKNEAEEIIHNLELQELTDRVDSLTGGWFSQELISRGLGSTELIGQVQAIVNTMETEDIQP